MLSTDIKNIKKITTILILDFGSQYTQIIARKVRELGVYCEIHDFNMADHDIFKMNPAGIILSGGPNSVVDEASPQAPASIFQLNVPILGICYGMQTMARQLGGEVSKGAKREFGYAKIFLQNETALLQKIEDGLYEDQFYLDVWMSHGDQVSKLPDNFITVARSDNCEIAAFADEKRKLYGLQFHPEVSHTKQGSQILRRFLFDICGCQVVWTAKNIIETQIKSIREQVGDAHVILGLSGGVDSSVAAMLIHQALGKQLTCVFVDTGLLRLNEAEQIKTIFSEQFGLNLICVDAKADFLAALQGVADPEAKRKIIGKKFIDVFEAEAAKIPQATFLAQGTIYSDVIESAGSKTGKADLIKSHHNVAGLPINMRLKLLEPLRELFKDEVRKIGLALGLPAELIERHPFPGPGLGVRILGEIKEDYLHILKEADAILIEELHKAQFYQKISQAFAVFLPVKSVGVVGDARQYEYVIAIRVVETQDFMTAHWSHLPYDVLANISRRILNEVSGVSRVTYDISNKPPATIEWE